MLERYEASLRHCCMRKEVSQVMARKTIARIHAIHVAAKRDDVVRLSVRVHLPQLHQLLADVTLAGKTTTRIHARDQEFLL